MIRAAVSFLAFIGMLGDFVFLLIADALAAVVDAAATTLSAFLALSPAMAAAGVAGAGLVFMLLCMYGAATGAL